MKRNKWIFASLLITTILLSACGSQNDTNISTQNPISSMMGNGGMMGNNNMTLHMATIPEPYAGLENPISADEESIFRGQTIFTNNCATCHGDGGMGDGPASVALDPPPAAIAHTGQMLSDGYMFWRITEGGTEFQTAMIPFESVLSEDDRWDVINYVRALGNNDVMPQEMFGGMQNSASYQTEQQEEMLKAAVDQKFFTQEEADFFEGIHPIIDDYIENNRSGLGNGNMPMMESGLEAMVGEEIITENEAIQFSELHDRLLEAGLMQ